MKQHFGFSAKLTFTKNRTKRNETKRQNISFNSPHNKNITMHKQNSKSISQIQANCEKYSIDML